MKAPRLREADAVADRMSSSSPSALLRSRPRAETSSSSRRRSTRGFGAGPRTTTRARCSPRGGCARISSSSSCGVVHAEGRVGDPDPLLAIADALATFPADENPDRRRRTGHSARREARAPGANALLVADVSRRGAAVTRGVASSQRTSPPSADLCSPGRTGRCRPSLPMERTLDPARLGDHLDRLYRAAWALCGSREDAEDLVQETYARVLAGPRLLRNEDDLGYLLRALRNTFLNRAEDREPSAAARPAARAARPRRRPARARSAGRARGRRALRRDRRATRRLPRRPRRRRRHRPLVQGGGEALADPRGHGDEPPLPRPPAGRAPGRGRRGLAAACRPFRRAPSRPTRPDRRRPARA